MNLSMVSGLCTSLIVVYLIMTVFFYVYQPKLLYHPWSEVEATPADIGLTYEEHKVTTSDDVEISVWLVPHASSRGVVLFSHGNAGNMSTRLDTFRIIHALGFSVCMYDYRGYGMSAGRPSEQGMYADVAAVYQFVCERGFSEGDIVVWGRSLGAAVSAWCAAHNSPRALILESGFTSIPDMAQKLYPYLPARLLARFDYATEEHVQNVRCPALVIHSPDDQLVPYAHGRQLYDMIAGEKSFCEIHGDHGNGYLTSENVYAEGVDAFLKKIGL